MRRPQSALNSATAGAALVVAVGLGIAATVAPAQQLFQAPAPPPPATTASASANFDPMASARNPRALLRNGIDFVKYKDYPRALRMLREAERRQNELDPSERKALAMSIAHVDKMMREGSVKPSPAALANANLPKRDVSAVQAGAMALASNEPAPKGDDVQLTSNEAPKLSLDAPAADPAPPAEQPASMRVELPSNDVPAPARPAPAPAPFTNPAPPPTEAAPAPPPVVELPAPAPLPAPASSPIPEGPSARPEPLPDLPKPGAPTPAPSAPATIGLEPLPEPAAQPPAAAAVPTPSEPVKPEDKPAPEPEARPAIGLQALPEPMPALAPAPAPAQEPAPTRPSAPAPAPAPTPVEEPAPTTPAPTPTPAPEQPLPVTPLGTPTPAPAPTTGEATPPVSPAVEPPPAVEAEAVAPGTPAPEAAPAPVPAAATPREASLPASSSLPSDIQEEIAKIARREAEQDPKPSQIPAAPEDPSTGLAPDSATRFELPRPPSSTEARPLRRIPVPEEFVPMSKRDWAPSKKFWAAPATCHMPLYFQDAALERYGHSVESFMGTSGRFLTYPLDKPSQSKQRNQIFQPFFSAGLFAFQIATLPYRVVVDPPWEAEYDLGYYRPGDRMPRSTVYFPWTGVGPPLQGRNY